MATDTDSNLQLEGAVAPSTSTDAASSSTAPSDTVDPRTGVQIEKAEATRVCALGRAVKPARPIAPATTLFEGSLPTPSVPEVCVVDHEVYTVDPSTGTKMRAAEPQSPRGPLAMAKPQVAAYTVVDPATGRQKTEVSACACPVAEARAPLARAAQAGHLGAPKVDPGTGKTIPESVPSDGGDSGSATGITPGIGFYPNYPWSEYLNEFNAQSWDRSLKYAKEAGITRTVLFLPWLDRFYTSFGTYPVPSPCPYFEQIDKDNLRSYIYEFLDGFAKPLMDHVGAAYFHIEIVFGVHDPKAFATKVKNGQLLPCLYRNLSLLEGGDIPTAVNAFNDFYDAVYEILCQSSCRMANFIMSLGNEIDLYIKVGDSKAWAGYRDFYELVSSHARKKHTDTDPAHRVRSVSVGVTVNFPNVLNQIFNGIATESVASATLADINQHSDVVIFNYYPRASWALSPGKQPDKDKLYDYVRSDFVTMMEFIRDASQKKQSLTIGGAPIAVSSFVGPGPRTMRRALAWNRTPRTWSRLLLDGRQS